jgi:uncharacterized protein (TIGR02452 family)
MNKNQLIEVFEDTQSIATKGNSITEKYTTDLLNEVDLDANYEEMNIQTINSDTVSAAHIFSKLGKTCVLNMASARKAGGGVANGAKAQEECLFRCSNLTTTVVQDFYPLKYNEALYTTDAVFFKDKNYNLIDPFTVDVVTIAAVNLNPNARYDDEVEYEKTNYRQVTMNKIRLMLLLANMNKCENIILGAWGCGVFKNNPIMISDMFHEIINRDFKGSFKNIIFAVINDHNSAGDNYSTFVERFNKE